MMRLTFIFTLMLGLTSCWPSSLSLSDKGSMPEEWKTFTVQTLENRSSTAPSNYSFTLTEAIKDGVQNNTRLLLNPNDGAGEISIEGSINSYNVAPIALQPGDVAAKNRLTIQVNFSIFVSEPEEDLMEISVARFANFDSNQDISSVENSLIEEINAQIVQDVISKLLSNW
jgi:hypothetical protein